MIGLISKISKPFCNIKKKYIQYFTMFDNYYFVLLKEI